MTQVSIILVNYNTLQLTTDCIESIKKYTSGIEYEVIVVDNASMDGSIDYFSKRKDVLFIESGLNIGFGRANNLGADKASGKYLFFLNTDTILLNNAIKIFYDFYEKSEKDIGTIGCWMLDTSNNIVHSYKNSFPSIVGCFKDVFCYFFRRCNKKYTSFKIVSPLYKEVAIVSGADMFIPKKVFKKIHGFDSDYFMYGEEVELEYRIMKAGYKRILLPEPKIIHLEGCSSNKKEKKISFFQFYSMKRGRILFYRKHKSLLYRICILFTEFFIDCAFILIDSRFKGKRIFYIKLYKLLFKCNKIKEQSTDLLLYR